MRTAHLSPRRLLSLAAMWSLLTAGQTFAGGVTITIVNINAPGVGFNDPTPVAPVGGNTGTTLGQQRLIAFQHAAEIWGQTLDSPVPVVVRAQFTALARECSGQCRRHLRSPGLWRCRLLSGGRVCSHMVRRRPG